MVLHMADVLWLTFLIKILLGSVNQFFWVNSRNDAGLHRFFAQFVLLPSFKNSLVHLLQIHTGDLREISPDWKESI